MTQIDGFSVWASRNYGSGDDFHVSLFAIDAVSGVGADFPTVEAANADVERERQRLEAQGYQVVQKVEREGLIGYRLEKVPAAPDPSVIVEALNARIHQELVRISGGRGLDRDGVPFHPDGDDHFHSPSHQVTARLDDQNFSLIPCWSGLHAHLAYALATIEHPSWSVKLVGAEEGEILRTYRVAAGDAADGECDCGSGDYCPQYGRKGGPVVDATDVAILEGPDFAYDGNRRLAIATVRWSDLDGNVNLHWVSRDMDESLWQVDQAVFQLPRTVQDALAFALAAKIERDTRTAGWDGRLPQDSPSI